MADKEDRGVSEGGWDQIFISKTHGEPIKAWKNGIPVDPLTLGINLDDMRDGDIVEGLRSQTTLTREQLIRLHGLINWNDESEAK